MATNHCLNRLQAYKEANFQWDDKHDEPTSGANQSPDNVRLHVERDEAICAAILDLPPHYRAVIELRHFQDLTYAQIAEQLKNPSAMSRATFFEPVEIWRRC